LAASKQLTFRPEEPVVGTQHIGLRVSDQVYLKIKDLADKHNMPLAEFARQALMFALEHIED
jgi:hypothetical protein